jgi:hypothetical protein
VLTLVYAIFGGHLSLNYPPINEWTAKDGYGSAIFDVERVRVNKAGLYREFEIYLVRLKVGGRAEMEHSPRWPGICIAHRFNLVM